LAPVIGLEVWVKGSSPLAGSGFAGLETRSGDQFSQRVVPQNGKFLEHHDR
jgi:hypothetical protein